MHEPLNTDGLRDEDLTQLLQSLRAPEGEFGPRGGFYARVMDRVETQRKSSIWSVFLEPVFSLRLAAASLVLALLMGVALFTSGPSELEEQVAFDTPVTVMDETQAAPALGSTSASVGGLNASSSADALHAAPVSTMGTEQGREVVLVDLVSYQEH